MIAVEQLERYSSVYSESYVAKVLNLAGRTRPDTALHHDPLSGALERGRRAQAQLLAAEGGTLGAAEVAVQLGIPVEEVAERQQVGRLLAVDVGGGWRYPAWQLADQRVIPGLEDVLAALREETPWSQM